MRRRLCRLVIVCAGVAVVLAAGVARGAVRVDQDEVIFSLRAPEASEVYLVGDFNQWNPTVEPMNRVDDRFEIGLFLVAGTYRYKFVVDGQTIADPDNPGRSPEKGSPLSLVERSGGLILSTELPEDTGPAAQAEFAARYIGRFTGESGDTDGAQRVDGFMSARFDRLRARAAVATHDSSWTWSPLSIDAYFDRGFVEAELGKLSIRGFENDTTWSSSDPMRLVGDAGVYGYDAGFRRHGVSAVAKAAKLGLRAFYADETTRHPASVLPTPDLDGFAAGTGADTTAYAATASFDGSDAVALEAEADFGDVELGYTRRDESGVNPGTVAEVTRTGTGFETTRYATREDRAASVAWLSYQSRGLRATGAYGWGGTTARAYAMESASAPAPAPQFTGTGSAVDATLPVGETDRGVLSLETTGDGASATLSWDYTRFDFDGVAGASRAEVNRALLCGGAGWKQWTFSGSAEYTRARYGATPDALHIDWPEQNVWLSLWDAFDPERLAAADRATYTVWRLGANSDGERIDGFVDVAYVAEDVAGALVQASARGQVEWSVAGPWRALADARIAGYDGGDTFESFYLEAGYRARRFDASVGFGFDPFVFDPVISDYADIGREQALRASLDGGFARSRAGVVTADVRARENTLADVRLIKVEFVVRLP
jgi:hypothetical protein